MSFSARRSSSHAADADVSTPGASPGKRSLIDDIAPKVGVSPGSVNVHEGDGVAEAAGARALTKGSDIHFAAGELGGKDGAFLAGHELTHVAQQRAGGEATQMKPQDGAAKTALEAEADHLGAAAAAGKDVSSQVTGRAVPGSVQCFESDEHKEIGDDATKGAKGEVKMVQLAADYRITYGEMVAMAGDYFESIGQMREFAAKASKGAETREVLEYVRIVEVGGAKGREGEFSKEAVHDAKQRYYALAAHNPSHFVNPEKGDASKSTLDKAQEHGNKQVMDTTHWTWKTADLPNNAAGFYRMNHKAAIQEAWEAGKKGQSIDAPMAVEAFSNHYLTDSFSAGHNRTARTGATEYWNTKLPMFFYNFKGFMAEQIAKYINDNNWRGDLVSVDLIWGKTKSTLDATLLEKGMPDFTFGDLVSGAIHDYDNTKGITASIDGQDKQIFGDGNLHKGDTKDAVVKAVQASEGDIEKAYEAGKQGLDPTALTTQLTPGGLFRAEQMIPVAKPDAQLADAQKSIKWDYGSAYDLLADAKFREGLKIFLSGKKSELAAVGAGLDADYKREAFKHSIVDHMAGDEGINMIWKILYWTPNTGGGVGGHNQDDNAMDYYHQAKKTPGGLASLMPYARIRIIQDLVDGYTAGDEEDAILEVLTTGSDSDAHQVIKAITWDRLEDEVGDRFVKRYPKAQYGAK